MFTFALLVLAMVVGLAMWDAWYRRTRTAAEKLEDDKDEADGHPW